MIIIGLTGGIGNCLMALPAIKQFSRAADVSLVVDADYEAKALFRRCKYIRKVYSYGERLPKATRYLAPYSVPAVMRGTPVEFIGWPHGTTSYPRPEWQEIKVRSGCGDSPEDVTDWCVGLKREKSVDFALLPCGKPGTEWARKKWGGFLPLVNRLLDEGHSVQAFGQADEIKEADLMPWWRGSVKLEDLPDELARCRVAIANDCGPGHLASSIGIPTLMLFTATSPVKGQPVGPHRIIHTGCARAPMGCQSTPLWRECTDWTCGNTTPELVLSVAEEMLAKK